MFGAPNRPFSGWALCVGVPHALMLVCKAGACVNLSLARTFCRSPAAQADMPVGDARATAAVRPRAQGGRVFRGGLPFPPAIARRGVLGRANARRDIAGHEA